MLEIKFVRENLARVEEALLNRGVNVDLTSFQEVESKRRSVLLEVEGLRHRRNVVSNEIAAMKKNKVDSFDLVYEMREVSAKIKELDRLLTEYDEEIQRKLLEFPNLPHQTVPLGKDSSDNQIHAGYPYQRAWIPGGFTPFYRQPGKYDAYRATPKIRTGPF